MARLDALVLCPRSKLRAATANAGALLRQATACFDQTPTLRTLAGNAWQGGFCAGGEWMRHALAHLRGTPPPGHPTFQRLGTAKYAAASAAAIAVIAGAVLLHCRLASVLGVPAFYAVEAQMVFLFPLALDGSSHPFRDARRWTCSAGGTFAVMRVVVPIAAFMLLGGFAGRGFVRSWCIGCLAICVWYEQLRTAPT